MTNERTSSVSDHSSFRRPPIPLDWDIEFSRAPTAPEWIAEPFLPTGRQITVAGAAKTGKSLLIGEMAACIASGQDFLGFPVTRSSVVYLDFENDPAGDVIRRLKDMGFGPGDLEGLHYFSYPELKPFDTPDGGNELLVLLEEYKPGLVVIDTASRTIAGKENENDTWAAFYRHTGMPLRNRGIAMVRIDHTGKDPGKGPRGASGKTADVDGVWILERPTKNGRLRRLTCASARWPNKTNVLDVEVWTTPRLHHALVTKKAGSSEERIMEIADLLDREGLSRGLSIRDTREHLKALDVRLSTENQSRVVKERKKRLRELGDVTVAVSPRMTTPKRVPHLQRYMHGDSCP
jgi:hypothetical protein